MAAPQGLSHITKAIASLVVLRDAMMRGNWVDDRPPRTDDGWIEELNKRAAALLEKYPNPVPAYTEAEHGERRLTTKAHARAATKN